VKGIKSVMAAQSHETLRSGSL